MKFIALDQFEICVDGVDGINGFELISHFNEIFL